MHRLFKKQSMDAVNEALMKETEYPAADKTYKNPWYFKGTEPDFRTGSKRGSRWNKKLDYFQVCQQALDALQALAAMTTDPDIKACAEMSAGDLEHFIGQESGAATSKGKRGSIKLHEEPKFLPPRPELRSHLDEDLKEELALDTALPVKHYKRFAYREIENECMGSGPMSISSAEAARGYVRCSGCSRTFKYRGARSQNGWPVATIPRHSRNDPKPLKKKSPTP